MNLRSVSKKIKSVTSVGKITKAMQLVSAVKMKKAQQIALDGRPYQQFLERAIYKILKTSDFYQSALMKENSKAKDKELVIAISANKGLCGSFNFNLVRFLIKQENFKKTDFITVGKKGTLLLSLSGSTIVFDYSGAVALDAVSAVFEQALRLFLDGQYSRVSIAYNKFISTLRYSSVKEILLPVSINKNEADKGQTKEYLIEPSSPDVLDALLKNYIEEKIRYSMIENEAGEHSARMIAMKNATDNSVEVMYSLTLLRNKLRQQKITYELLDMITAKESVELD